ncbi:MAG: SCP2 sterol-binding domain-containing protein [Clostridiales bacterium]|nr:SCP2 sterol-binding domain-containing protein [Clostridiales bacterium]
MKIIYIYGNMKHYDHGLEKILSRTKNIFFELNVETETIDLGALHPPHYEGETIKALDDVMEKMKSANGIVLACTAQLFAPTALMQSFFEYLEHPDYSGVFESKHCMLVALSRNGGERTTLHYLSRMVRSMGGFDVSQIGLQTSHLEEMQGETGEFVDWATEDFYRAVHKNRKYIMPSDFSLGESIPVAVDKIEIPTAELIRKENIESDFIKPFNEMQEKEIEELSQLFSKKYSGGDFFSVKPDKPAAPAIAPSEKKPIPLSVINSPAKPKTSAVGTVEGFTQNLPDYFQPQLSAGLQAVVQINITGSENFDGFLYIHSTECTYTKGNAPAPDIIIMADAAVWLDVLKNKTTAQKAFMIGGIKVRGDFVLLTKFDSMFKFPES